MSIEIACISASGCIQRLPNGDPGEVLTIDGAGQPNWMPSGIAPTDPVFRMMIGMGGDSLLVANGYTTTLRAQQDFTVLGLRASLAVASVSGDVIFDLQVNGSSILSQMVRIEQGQKTSLSAVLQPIVMSPLVNDDDELKVVVMQEGSGAYGAVFSIRGQ